jgi:ribonuclease P protein component
MLKKESKLTAEDLLKLKKEGKRVHSTLFSVTYLPYLGLKVGVTVPKKLYKNAVDRNRSKRRVFGAIESLSSIKSGQYELFLKQNIDNITPEQLKSDISGFLCQK